MRNPIFRIARNELSYGFPDTEEALSDPDGLLAAGGDLSIPTLLEAYEHGIFPWFSTGQPILWWSPNPRTVMYPGSVRVSRSLRRTINRSVFRVSMDRNFSAVIAGCAEPRPGQCGTWLTGEMIDAYRELSRHGYAHSVECWHDGELAGGLYGLAIGRVFFGESMFSRRADASKVALVYLMHNLQRWDYALVDCQIYSEHLERLGAVRIPRHEFIDKLRILCGEAPETAAWQDLETPNFSAVETHV